MRTAPLRARRAQLIGPPIVRRRRTTEPKQRRAGHDRLAGCDRQPRSTRPARGARTSFCIFIASMVRSAAPSSTSSPASTATATTSPGRRGPDDRPARLAPRPASRPRPADAPASADGDRDATPARVTTQWCPLPPPGPVRSARHRSGGRPRASRSTQSSRQPSAGRDRARRDARLELAHPSQGLAPAEPRPTPTRRRDRLGRRARRLRVEPRAAPQRGQRRGRRRVRRRAAPPSLRDQTGVVVAGRRTPGSSTSHRWKPHRSGAPDQRLVQRAAEPSRPPPPDRQHGP